MKARREGNRIGRILLVWELGGAMGHLARLAPVARCLAERGHTVVAALRPSAHTPRFFDGIRVVAAPDPEPAGAETGDPSESYADILRRAGWKDATTLSPRIAAWRAIFDDVAPDVAVFDHSPTALLASHGRAMRRVLLGTGFASPPDVSPLPTLRPVQEGVETEGTADAEAAALAAADACLVAMGCPALERLASLFARVDANLLATWPELDHYGAREGADYCGVWEGDWGDAPRWPDGRGPRVFAYLKPFAALPALAHLLQRSRLPSLLVVPGLDAARAKRLGARNVRVVTEPVDLARAAAGCRIGIVHATHGTTATLLRAGRPLLAIPLQVEQSLVARRVAQAGAGLLASHDAPDQIARALQHLLVEPRFEACAREIAARYAGFDPAVAIDEVVDRIEALVPRAPTAHDA